MNFLGHVFLSGDDPDLLFGNYIGDFVKGSQHEDFPEAIQKGILLHREIDAYTDRHPMVLNSKEKLRSPYRHYAAVIVDLYYDHFLASLWGQYHPSSLKRFTEQVYEKVGERKAYLPAKAKRTFEYMSRDNWLYAYRNISGIEQALYGMSRRTRFNSRMDEAGRELRLEYNAFKSDFEGFVPDIKAFAENWRHDND